VAFDSHSENVGSTATDANTIPWRAMRRGGRSRGSHWVNWRERSKITREELDGLPLFWPRRSIAKAVRFL
jgi:hypothetical protein